MKFKLYHTDPPTEVFINGAHIIINKKHVRGTCPGQIWFDRKHSEIMKLVYALHDSIKELMEQESCEP